MSKSYKINEVDLTRDFSHSHRHSANSYSYGSSESLTSWWKFEELATITENDTLIYDYATGNNHGVYRGAVENITFTSAPGQASAAHFPGAVYATFPSMGTIGLVDSDISVAMWIKLPLTTPNAQLLLLGNNRVQISVIAGKLVLQLGIIEGEDADSFVLKDRAIWPTVVNDDEWHYVTYTYDAETATNTLYIDAETVGEHQDEEIYASSDTLGLSVPTGSSYPTFSISDLATWNAKLSLNEIRPLWKLYTEMRHERSGFMGYPARVLLDELDNSPNAYPTIRRAGPDIGSCSDPVRPYDDSKTVIFDSAYANAWIKFHGRPRDASTITLHDPAGSIDLLPATATSWTTLDDLTVSANGDLKVEQTYQVISYTRASITLQDPAGTHLFTSSADFPVVSGNWTGIKYIVDAGENIILEAPGNYTPWVGADQSGLTLKIQVTTLGMPDPLDGATDQYIHEITSVLGGKISIQAYNPGVKIKFVNGPGDPPAPIIVVNGEEITVTADFDEDPGGTSDTHLISEIVTEINNHVDASKLVIAITVDDAQLRNADQNSGGGNWHDQYFVPIGTSYVGAFSATLFTHAGVELASLTNLLMDSEEQYLNDLAPAGSENNVFEGIKISWPNPYNSDGGTDADTYLSLYSSPGGGLGQIGPTNAEHWDVTLSPPDKFLWRKANLDTYTGRNAWTEWYPGAENLDGEWEYTGQYIGAGNVRREYVLKDLAYSKADADGYVISDGHSLDTIDHISGSIPDSFQADVYIRGDISSSATADSNYEEEYYELEFGFDKQTWHPIGAQADFNHLKDAQRSPYDASKDDTGTYEYSPYSHEDDDPNAGIYAGRWAGPMAYAPFADGHTFSKDELQHVPKDDSGDPLYTAMPDAPHLKETDWGYPNVSDNGDVTAHATGIARAWHLLNLAFVDTPTYNIPSYMMYQEARDAGLITQAEVTAYIALGDQQYTASAYSAGSGLKLFRKIRYGWNDALEEESSSVWKITDGTTYSLLPYTDTYIWEATPTATYIGDVVYPAGHAYEGFPVYTNATDRHDTDKYGPTQLYFRVKPGTKVSWGRCQIKLATIFKGRFWYFDDIDNDTADGNNIRLSWENFIGHGYGSWTVHVEDSTKETFEFNRGRIVNPAYTAVNIQKMRKRDQINDTFARAVNQSELQIVAKSDGEKVLLTQTVPGTAGNLEIHADTRARCFISNSKLFLSGAKGEVTGSFAGGDDYLVSYPTLLPARVQMIDPDGASIYSSSTGHVASARAAGMMTTPYGLDSSGNKLYIDTNGNIITSADIGAGWSVLTGITEDAYMAAVDPPYTPASLSETEWLTHEGLTEGVHIESPWLDHRIMSPNSQSLDVDRGIVEAGLITTGACVKGVSDALLNFDSPPVGVDRHFITDPLNPQYLHEDYSTTPFVDDRVDIDIENEFYDEGTSQEIYEGLSSPLRSKTQVIIDLETVSPTTLGYDIKQRYRSGKVEGVGLRAHKFDFFEKYGHKWKVNDGDPMVAENLTSDLELTGESKNYFVFYARGDIDGRAKTPVEEVFKMTMDWHGQFTGQRLFKSATSELSDSRFYRYHRYITTGSLGGTGYTDAQGDSVSVDAATTDGTLNAGYTLDTETDWLEVNYPGQYDIDNPVEYAGLGSATQFTFELGGPDQGLSPRRDGPYSYFDFGNPHAVVILPPGTVTNIECAPGTEVDYGVNQVYMRIWPKAYSFGTDTAVDPDSDKTKLFNNMAYYNFTTKEWDEIGPGITTQPQGAEGHKGFFEDACLGFSRGVELIQTGTRAGALPITNFGFPSHPKFTATDDQAISMDKFIARPFILEKFVFEYEAAWAEGSDYSKRTVMYDVSSSGTLQRSDEDGNFNNKAALNSFFILNQRQWVGDYDYAADGQSVTRWGKPDYGRNVTHTSSNNAHNRYMWDGHDYPYSKGADLICWYRFNGDPISFFPSQGSGPQLQYDTWSYTNYVSPLGDQLPDKTTPAQDLSSPWELPDGVDTTTFDYSVKLAGDNFLTASLGGDSGFMTTWTNFFDTFGTPVAGDLLVERAADDHSAPPSVGWTQGVEWRFIATEGNYDVDGDGLFGDGGAGGVVAGRHPAENVLLIPFTERPDGTSFAPGSWSHALVIHNADLKESGSPAPVSGSYARYNVAQTDKMYLTYKFIQGVTTRYTFRDVIEMGKSDFIANPEFGDATTTSALFDQWSGWTASGVVYPENRDAIIHYLSSDWWYVTATDTIVPSGSIPTTQEQALSQGWSSSIVGTATDHFPTPATDDAPVEWDTPTTPNEGVAPGLDADGLVSVAGDVIVDKSSMGYYIPCVGWWDADDQVYASYIQDDSVSKIYTIIPQLSEAPDTWRSATSAYGTSRYSGYGSEALKLQISKTQFIDVDDESPAESFVDTFEPSRGWHDMVVHEPDYTKQGMWQSHATLINPKKYFGAEYTGDYYIRFYQEGATYPDAWAITDIYTKESFSIAFWFKVDAITSGWSNLLTIADSTGAPNKIWIAFRKGSLRMAVDTGDNRIKTIAKVSNNLGMEKGGWHHITFTFDQISKKCRFYADGELLITYEIPQKTDAQGELLWQSGTAEVTATEIDVPYDGTQTTTVAGETITLTEEEYMTLLGYPAVLPWEFEPEDVVVFGADVDKLTWKLAVALETMTGASQHFSTPGTVVEALDGAGYSTDGVAADTEVGFHDAYGLEDPAVISQPSPWLGRKFDNYFSGNFSDIAVWRGALSGLDIKGLYHLHKGGYYKKGLDTDISLAGNLPFRFDVPLGQDFTIRTPGREEGGYTEFSSAEGGNSLTDYNISNKLLARYLANPNEFNRIDSQDFRDTSIRDNLTGIIVGDINYSENGPWIPPIEPADIYVPDGLKFAVDFEDDKNDNKWNIDAHIKLPRAKDFFVPQEMTQIVKGSEKIYGLMSWWMGTVTPTITVDSYEPETFDAYPAFSVFAWIKIPDEQTVTDPVIFAINGKDGHNKLMFFIDTADKPGSGDSGDRLSLYVQTDRVDDRFFTDIPDEYSDGTVDLDADVDAAGGADYDLTRSGRYGKWFMLSTGEWVNPEIAAEESGLNTLRDGKWHFVGFTYEPGVSTDLDDDGNPLDDSGAESTWPVEYDTQVADLGTYTIYIDGKKQKLFKQTRIYVRGPWNDVYLHDFDYGLDPRLPASTGFNRKGDAWENTHSLRDTIESLLETFTDDKFNFGDYEKYQWDVQPIGEGNQVGTSNLHMSLKYDDLDRLSIGQEYDVKRWKSKWTGKTYRYRARSQIFNGQMADITMWSENITEDDVKVLYNTRFGSNEVSKWFNQFTATSRDLVTYGHWSIYAGITESSSDVNDLLESGLGREVTTLASMPSETYSADGTLVDHDGEPTSEMVVSGSYVMEGIVKRPVRHESGLAYKLGTKGGTSGYRSIYKTTHNGTRSGHIKDLSSARAIFNSVPGTDAAVPAEDFGREALGRDSTPLRIFEEGKEESPYVLYPTDKLVFGWQAAQPYDFKRVSDAGTGPHMSIAPEASEELPTKMKITLYGSYLSDGKETHDPLDQKLTSNALHEALQFETPVHDVFHLECPGYLAGTHRDDIVSGSIFIEEREDEARANNIIRRRVASISEGNQGITGSMLHGVRMVDSRERFYDTVVAAPSDYHEFNGNGVLEWRHPLFANNRMQRSLVFGEPRPSDQKVIQPEKTIIRCRADGWYEPVPRGVVKLTLTRLWTADHTNTQTIPYYELGATGTAMDSSPDYTSISGGSIYWDITQDYDDRWVLGELDTSGYNEWYYDATATPTSANHAYAYSTRAAGTNYMFSSYNTTLDEVEEGDIRQTYFSIYDAAGQHYIVWLNWGGTSEGLSDVSGNIIEVDLSGWDSAPPSNGWAIDNPEDVVTIASDWFDSSEGGGKIIDEWAKVNSQVGSTTALGGTAQEDPDTPTASDFYPSDAAYMSAATFTQKVAAAINATGVFEVLHNSAGTADWSEVDELASVTEQVCSMYIRTVTNGLNAPPEDLTIFGMTLTDVPRYGGGIPNVHYPPPIVDEVYLYRSYYKYVETAGRPIVGCTYSVDDLGYDGILASNDWGISRSIKDYITTTAVASSDMLTFTDDAVDWLGVASSLGFEGDGGQGIEDYITRIRPNNSTQFLHQAEVLEDVGTFSRVSDYSLDGAYFQIHDAKDTAYNVWYVLDDGDGSSPAPPTSEGTLITVDTIPPGSPASAVAKATFEHISGSVSLQDNFNVYYNDGDEFFTIENVQDGSAKDADSTIMGLPVTTGFYLTDEDGTEYDNEFSYSLFQWGGIFGSFSRAKISIDQETYTGGNTPEGKEVFWHGDPVQEGVDPYHDNTNALIDSYWMGSFPFEPRYASLRRRRWLKDDKTWNVVTWDGDTGEFTETSRTATSFTSVIITGSNIPTQMTDPAMDDGTETYQVLTVVSDGSPNINNSRLYNSGKTMDNFFKFYFGAGNTWQKNPEIQEEFIDSDGYSWPSAVPKIRGWKYGLKSAIPENSSAVYRHDTYGQFRDMLEQRHDTRFYKQLLRGSYAGFSFVSRPAVFVRFVDQNGRLTRPDKTWSQNLSKFCTSSLPYFDDTVPRNREHPLNEDDLNTTIVAVGE